MNILYVVVWGQHYRESFGKIAGGPRHISPRNLFELFGDHSDLFVPQDDSSQVEYS